MKEAQAKEERPFESWRELIEKSMSGYTVTQAFPGAARDGKEDPWFALIDRLWDASPSNSLMPLDPGEILDTFWKVWLDALSNPDRLWTLYSEFMQNYTQLMMTETFRLWGLDQESKPVIEPEHGDKRFSAADWQQNPVFDALKQSYLLAATTLLKTASGIKGLDERHHRQLTFFLRQYLDAISPTNFAFTNPQVIHEIIASGGQNLVKGMQNLMRDISAGELKITDTSAFEVGKNLAITPGQVVYRNELIELIQYAPMTEQVYQIPLLFVPPWVNKYYALDLQPDNSFMRFLVERGFSIFMISWKNPDASMEHIGFDDYVSLGPLAALEVVKEITGSPKVNTAGYCIAGEMLATVPPYLAAKGDDTINSVTFVVTVLDLHAEVNDLTAFMGEPAVRVAQQQMDVHGYLDSHSMMAMFEIIRANDLIWSNVINNYLLGKEPPAFDLLYWNNDGTRMTRDAHMFFLREIALENGLAKPNKIVIKGVPINLRTIKQDVYEFGAVQDHIVPWKAAWRTTQLTGGSVRFVLGKSGHIAGVASPPNKAKGYWTNEKHAKTADRWLETAEFHQGTWWTDWVEWLKPRSGEPVAPPSIGSKTHPPIVPAPGTYVLEK
ncbi:MAG: PHA/PHB synthase family protein [Ktedonobacteraceae bacterium]